ncbi:MAG TPA: hypothetical protein VJ898_14710 [Natrialbaceae archaeon]|nr:hypothetical protein [Natrialbaceae archaeon]
MPNPFTRRSSGEPDFDEYDELVPAHLPDPGPHLEDFEVLDDEDHVAVHRMVRDVFEERGVYDSTLGYNLAKLNLDPRHPDAGFRYAVEDDVLHAEFTPTTAFCPQGDVLTTAAHRALNGLSDRHEFERVAVHVDPVHQHSEAINAKLDGMDLEDDAAHPGAEDSGSDA